MLCFCRASEALREASSVLVVVSWASSSPRERWVEASSERICAREDGDDTSAAAAFPFGVSGRMVLVEAVGVVSSSVAAGCCASAAVRSASLVSGGSQYTIF